MNFMPGTDLTPHISAQTKGRLILLLLVLLFAIPAISAKVILSQSWYQSGVTNSGKLIEPRLTMQMLGLPLPAKKSWQLGYLLPERCDELCQKQVNLLLQSHQALGKYRTRVEPVLYLTANSDTRLPAGSFATMQVNEQFTRYITASELVIVDPLGQLVMHFDPPESESALVSMGKGLLSDLRKLLKLSRVG